MKNLLSFGVVVFGLLLCFGCDSKPPATEPETKQLYESPDYEKQMMGEMSGGAETSKE